MPSKKTRSTAKLTTKVGARVLVLRISITGLAPAVWRDVSVPETFTLAQLHRVIQTVFSWLDYHLYQFDVRETCYADPAAELDDARSSIVSLADFRLAVGDRFTYLYDFGDDWEHEITVQEAAPMPRARGSEQLFPQVLGGSGAAPPEDSGGPLGYQELLEALANPKHPGHRQASQWVPRGFDPTRFDLPSADHALVLACAWGAI
jgi:hypothetical protein